MVDRYYENIDEFRELFYEVSYEAYVMYQEQQKDELLNQMNSITNTEEIKQMLDRFGSVLGFDMNSYNALDEGDKRFVCEYLMNNRYNDTEMLREAFEEAVVVVQINNASDIRELWDITEANMDILHIQESTYYRVDKKYKIYARLLGRTYNRLEQYSKEFRNAVHAIYKNEATMSVGGGGYSGFELYFLTADNKKLETEPEYGTDVKAVVRAVYEGESNVTYCAAVYDCDGKMVSLKTFEPKATQVGESEFFEFNTTYRPDCQIKLFTWESLDGMKPTKEAAHEYFRYGMELPIPEEETEGIIAVKGFLSDNSNGTSSLSVTDMRMFGYWGAKCPEEPLTVNYSGVLCDVYRKIGISEIVFKLALNADGTYSIVSADMPGELVHYSGDDIVAVTSDTLTILVNGEEKSYSSYSDTNFLYETVDAEYNYIYVLNGSVRVIYGYDYIAAKVQSVIGNKIIFNDGMTFENESASKYFKADDVALISGEYIIKANAENAVYYEEYVLADSKEYLTGRENTDSSFVNGERCIVYTEPNGRYVEYLEKDFDNKDILLVTSLTADESGRVIFSTPYGDVEISGEVYIDGCLMNAEDALNMIGPGTVLWLDNSGENAILETAAMIEMTKGYYNSELNAIAGYGLSEGRYAAEFQNEYYTDLNLREKYLYEITVFSADGINADFVIIRAAAADISKYRYLLVTDSADGSLSGYCDGEFVTVECDSYDVLSGDMVRITSRKGSIVAVDRVMPYRCTERVEYFSGYVSCSTVPRVNGNYMFVKYNGAYQEIFAGEDTYIYAMNVAENTVEPATLSDIYYNRYMNEQSDFVLAEKIPGTNTARYIVIYKFN